MNLTCTHLDPTGDLNTGRHEQPMNTPITSNRKSKSGPDLPSADLLNGCGKDDLWIPQNRDLVLLKCVEIEIYVYAVIHMKVRSIGNNSQALKLLRIIWATTTKAGLVV